MAVFLSQVLRPLSTVSGELQAAKRGSASAQAALGICYEHGGGVAKDSVEAVKWYRKGAEGGDVLAQFNLGFCYGNGQGVTANYVESYKWLSLAAAQGDTNAATALPQIAKVMTPKQISEAKQLAREFTPKT